MFQKKCSTCKAEMIGDLHAECESCRAKSAQPVVEEKTSDTKATFRQIQDMCDKASDHAAYKGDARYKAFLLKAVASLSSPMYKRAGSETEYYDLIVEGRACTISHRAGRGLYYSVNGKETWDIFGKPVKIQ